jgi:RHS repeat-associated protein
VGAVLDLLNANLSQSFTYDKLNRLTSAQQSASTGFGQNFQYDPWGSLYSINHFKGSTPDLSTTADANNRLAGFTYDSAGDLIQSGSVHYGYDAEGRMTNVASGSAVYTYDLSGHRVVKNIGGDITNYIYFGDQMIAEYHNGDWSDYIYAGPKRVARADSFDNAIVTWGTNCTNCGSQAETFSFSGAQALSGYVVRSGDKLAFRQNNNGGAHGGIMISFTDGSNTNWVTHDQNGCTLDDCATTGQWLNRIVDLSSYAGKTITGFALVTESTTPDGSNWSIGYSDIVVVSTDGTAQSIYNRQPSVSLSTWKSAAGTSINYAISHWSTASLVPTQTTTYYHVDHLGTTRLLTNGFNAFPSLQSTFTPYGYEVNAQDSQNHYKYTGQERDSETGLDHFMFREYTAPLGRWMRPDPAGLAAVDLANPQTWNQYAYVGNSPTTAVDPLGLFQVVCNRWNNFCGTPPGDPVGNLINLRRPPRITISELDDIRGCGTDDNGKKIPCKKPADKSMTSEQHRCNNAVITEALIYGLAAALNIGPQGSTPDQDMASAIRTTAKNPVIRAQAGIIVAQLGAAVFTKAGAVRIGTLISEELVPGVGWAMGAYMAYNGVKGGWEYYKENSPKCFE